ncbi:MAG TPA: hypothetical protein VF884_16055, partial [Nitrososphaeraceae archaeon]
MLWKFLWLTNLRRTSVPILTGVVLILSVFCNSKIAGSLSIDFHDASGQSGDQGIINSSPSSSTAISIKTKRNAEDRAQLTMETAKKLRDIQGESIPNQYIVVLKSAKNNAEDIMLLAN